MKKDCLFLLILSLFANAQQTPTLRLIQDNFFNQLELYPQEKIHLHTDRTIYVPGEKIWFKAYVVDAWSHQFPTHSRYVYVELINSSDSLVHRVMVSPDENELFHGNIFLSSLIPEGDYTLRAYTRYMENLGDDYFFKKNVRIGSLRTSARVTPANPEPEIRNTQDYDVSFYPEGGYLTEGVLSRVAFKALNQQGASEIITGNIIDNENVTVVADVRTVFAGMGSFTFVPDPTKTYDLVCKSQSGQEKRFRLPVARKTCSINTLFRNDRHFIAVKKSPGIQDEPLYLLVHHKGEVLYFDLWDHQKEYIPLTTEQLPFGVVQVILFDSRMNPVSERLIFNKKNDQATLSLTFDKPVYQIRDKVASEIFLADKDGNTLGGHVSIAVTDNNDIAIDSFNTITASLLLTSELKGYIECPGYYLQDHQGAIIALDHLMMTHGWRRYAVSDAVKGSYSRPGSGFELTKEITGTVKSGLLNRPVSNSEVTVFSMDHIPLQTVTDTAGVFRLELHYPDSALLFVQARNQRGSDRVELTINNEVFPALIHAPVSLSLLPAVSEKENERPEVITGFLNKAEQRVRYTEDMMLVNLDEITVTAQRIDKRDELRLRIPINASSDLTVYREDIESKKQGASRITDLLINLPGIRVSNSTNPDAVQIFILPQTKTFGEAEVPALILIDGIEILTTSVNALLAVQDVESIDVFKSTGASMFGTRGMFGAINITTRKWNPNDNATDYRSNSTTVAPLGFQKPVEFYAPKYDTPEAKNFRIPDFRTTIFWKPDQLISDYGIASFDFYTADFPSTYSILIEGISEEGTIIRHVETIEVR